MNRFLTSPSTPDSASLPPPLQLIPITPSQKLAWCKLRGKVCGGVSPREEIGL